MPNAIRRLRKFFIRGSSGKYIVNRFDDNYNDEPIIGAPYDVKHIFHIGFNDGDHMSCEQLSRNLEEANKKVLINKSKKKHIKKSNLVVFTNEDQTNENSNYNKPTKSRTNSSNTTTTTKSSKDKKILDIGQPFNFNHVVHIGIDSETHNFTGLPSDWAKEMKRI